MTVKNIICDALNMAGRSDLAESLAHGGVLDSEQTRLKDAFLLYFNAVVDELARGYFPLDAVDKLTSQNGVYALSSLSKPPIRIRRVTDGKKPVGWRIYPDYLHADAKSVEVFYEYSPEIFAMDDEFVYPVHAVGHRVIIYGMLAEHYLVLGDYSGCKGWESKYRNEIEMLLSNSPLGDRIPPRRWI